MTAHPCSSLGGLQIGLGWLYCVTRINATSAHPHSPYRVSACAGKHQTLWKLPRIRSSNTELGQSTQRYFSLTIKETRLSPMRGFDLRKSHELSRTLLPSLTEIFCIYTNYFEFYIRCIKVSFTVSTRMSSFVTMLRMKVQKVMQP